MQSSAHTMNSLASSGSIAPLAAACSICSAMLMQRKNAPSAYGSVPLPAAAATAPVRACTGTKGGPQVAAVHKGQADALYLARSTPPLHTCCQALEQRQKLAVAVCHAIELAKERRQKDGRIGGVVQRGTTSQLRHGARGM